MAEVKEYRDEKYSDWRREIDQIADQIFDQISREHLHDTDEVSSVIDNTVDGWVLCDTEALDFMKKSPYEWLEFSETIDDAVKFHHHDLGEVLVTVAKKALSCDVNETVFSSRVFEFMQEETPMFKLFELGDPKNPLIISFKEVFKPSTEVLDHLPQQEIIPVNDKELIIYREGDEQIATLDHEDRYMMWKSDFIIKKQNIKTIADYENLKCGMLCQYGFPPEELWLSECTSVDSFSNYYGIATTLDLELNQYKGVVYYHESGNIHGVCGFNNFEEFREACECVAKSIS